MKLNGLFVLIALIFGGLFCIYTVYISILYTSLSINVISKITTNSVIFSHLSHNFLHQRLKKFLSF